MTPTFIDHIVLIVKDVSTSESFYAAFLGDPAERHEDSVCFQVGEVKLFLGFPYKKYGKTDKDRGGLNHLAFGVRTEEQLEGVIANLNRAGIENSGVLVDEHGGQGFVWFDDPDGIRLEVYIRG